MLGVPGLRIVVDAAPQGVAELTPPDAVFVGGGISDPALLPALWERLRPGGRLVANVVSSEGERAILDWQARHGGELCRIAVSRCEPLGGHHGWRPLLPVTQLHAAKPR
jgi:precorrin-6B C5,15-methyltransferase / cobalt-precorrin-6B C5,C15-methyltransferase